MTKLQIHQVFHPDKLTDKKRKCIFNKRSTFRLYDFVIFLETVQVQTYASSKEAITDVQIRVQQILHFIYLQSNFIDYFKIWEDLKLFFCINIICQNFVYILKKSLMKMIKF